MIDDSKEQFDSSPIIISKTPFPTSTESLALGIRMAELHMVGRLALLHLELPHHGLDRTSGHVGH